MGTLICNPLWAAILSPAGAMGQTLAARVYSRGVRSMAGYQLDGHVVATPTN